MTQVFTDLNFNKEVLASEKPVLVDFYTPSCGPCRKLAPTIDKLAEELANKLVVGKCDVSENNETGVEYGITAVPCLMLFVNGKNTAKQLGLISENNLRDWINSQV